MRDKTSLRIRFPSRPGLERAAMGTAARCATGMGFSPDRVEDLKTAVAEACINAMEHGNLFEPARSVEVTLCRSSETLEICVLDEGSGLLGRPDAPDIHRKIAGQEGTRGMGVFLIKALVDEAEWGSTPAGRSYVRLRVRLRYPLHAAPELLPERKKPPQSDGLFPQAKAVY